MNRQNKQKEIHFLVNKDEYDLIKGKADSAKMKVGKYVREIAINGKIQPITNGKELARQMGTIHSNFINLHNDMMNHVDELNNALDNQNKLLRQYSDKNISPIFVDTLQLQQRQVTTVIGIIKNVYSETYRKAQEGIIHCVNPIVREVISNG